MRLHSLPHDIDQAVDVHRRHMRPPTVAVVNRAIWAGQEHRHRQVEIEREQVEIDLVDIDDAHADVVFGGIFEFLWGTDNLPVKKSAVYSGFAAKHDEHRLSFSCGQLPGFIQISQPREALPSARRGDR